MFTLQMGHVVPLMESEMANVIPMWMDAPIKREPQRAEGSSAVRVAIAALSSLYIYM